MNVPSAEQPINLLPISRQIRNARSMAISRWVSTCVIFAAGAFIPAAALALGSEDDLAPVRARIERNQQGLAKLHAEQPKLGAELVRLTERERLLTIVESGIDWLPLLGAISDAASPARFEQIEMGINEGEERIDIRLVGHVETQSDARELVLRLEQVGPLDDLTLNTSKVTLEREIYQFTIVGRVSAGWSD